MASILVSMESRLLDCEGGVYALLFICVSEIHRLMAAKGAAVDDKGLLQDAETIDEDGTTYIVIKEEYRQHVFGRSGVTMLPRLGPAELYEVWKNEVLPFLQRAAADPTVLCDRRGWRQCYTSTLTQQYGRLNEAMHGVGNKQGGVDAADKKLTTTFWQQATEAWSKQASRLATDETFLLLAKIGVAEYETGVRRNVLGWFEEMEGNTPKWIRFKQLSHRCCRALALTSRSSVTASGHTTAALKSAWMSSVHMGRRSSTTPSTARTSCESSKIVCSC